MADFLSIAATLAGGGLAGVGSFQSVRAFWTARLLGATGPTPLVISRKVSRRCGAPPSRKGR